MPTIQEIKEKIRTGTATIDEVAAGILNDKYLLFNFLMDNNLADINQTIRLTMGRRDLPFAPNRAAIEREIHAAIQKNDTAFLNTIIREFDRDKTNPNYTNNPELLTKLKFLK